MRVDRAGALHLTYCTNIHAADGWPAVLANVRRYAPVLKRRFSPEAPFGVGLRLSASEARELLVGHALDEFRSWLDDQGLYVAIINGFPYGAFHRTAVKADVYAPDWREPAREAYTCDLIDIVSRLAPAGVDAGVSTSPLSYKAWVPATDRDGWRTMTEAIARVAVRLAEVRRRDGTLVHLDIEPEPDCVLETTDEAVAFFRDWLLPIGAPVVAAACGLSRSEAEDVIRDHIRLCFDCCHMAVEYEDAREALARLGAAGIKIGRIQLSSAIRVGVPHVAESRTGLNRRLTPFADSTYLHQVIARQADALRHFPDLDAAIACGDTCGDEWRIHFHVPLFARDFEGLGSTQDYVADVIHAAARNPITTHLEIETYTWDVLPPTLKLDLGESIGREYDWVLRALQRSHE